MADEQKGEPIPGFLRRGAAGGSGSIGGTVPGFESSIPVTRINIPPPPRPSPETDKTVADADKPPPDKLNNVEPYPVSKIHKEWVTTSAAACVEHLERVWFGQATAQYILENTKAGYKLTVDISLTRRAMDKSAGEQKPPIVKKHWWHRAYLWWLGLDHD